MKSMPSGFTTVHHCSSHDNQSQIIKQVLASSIDLATTTPSIWTLMGGGVPGSRCSLVCVNCRSMGFVLVLCHLPWTCYSRAVS
jgi:hypothetical protein